MAKFEVVLKQLLCGCEKGMDSHGFSRTDREDRQAHVSVYMVLHGHMSMCIQVDLTLLHSGEERQASSSGKCLDAAISV